MTRESRVLEIGCGPGTLTQSIAKLGCEVVALELGKHLAEAAARNLASYARVRVLHTSFEDWELPSEGFDAVVAAGSYHWLDPAIRVRKILDALKPGGCVAVLNKHRVRSDNAEFEDDIRACYVRWDPEASPEFQHPVASEVNPAIDDLLSEPTLLEHAIRSCRDDVRYDSRRYRDLLKTYSDYTLMSTQAQEGLADCICSLIDSKYGGVLVMPLLCTIHVARKRAA